MGRVVLGIDAAWTVEQPSGVALVIELDDRWRLLATAPSYEAFLAPAGCILENASTRGAVPDARALLDAASARCERPVDVVAVDMPLSRSPIVGRRASDDAVARAYGARWCAPHTPSAARPGPLSDRLRMEFDEAGYPLATKHMNSRSLIEVYPHPALVELMRADRRLPYKAQKTSTYWPGTSATERRGLLLSTWDSIVAHLDAEIDGTRSVLGSPLMLRQGREMKAWEDMLDAVICAWVGVVALNGRANPFGDHSSTIWIPQPRG